MPFSIRKGSKAALEGAPREHRREQGRARESTREAWASIGGSPREHWGAATEQEGAQQKERFWLLGKPNLAALYSAIAAPIIYPVMLPGLACCCLDSYSFAGSKLHFELMECFFMKARPILNLYRRPDFVTVKPNLKTSTKQNSILEHLARHVLTRPAA